MEGYLSILLNCQKKHFAMGKHYNWAGNYEYSTDRFHYPETLEEVQQVVKQCSKVKVLGTRHSFNGIGDSTENILSLDSFKSEASVDEASRTVTVGAGIRYGELCQHLHGNGFALHNLGSLPHISVAGACASGTHGSGVKNGNLATAVAAIEMVTASGDLVILSRKKNPEIFSGAVVNLGGLGVITNITLDIVPAFHMKQEVYENVPLPELDHMLDEILSTGYSVSLFTNWRNRNFSQVWVKRRIEDAHTTNAMTELFSVKPATTNLHPIVAMPPENCTEQLGISGPWHERLPHFRMEFTPSSGQELQSEYFVPRIYAHEAVLAMDQMRQLIAPHLLISEIRTVEADDLWMSPCYKQASLALHFTWKPDWPSVRELLPKIEKKLEPFYARPHWGKLFTTQPSRFQSLYEKLPDFQQLLTSYDPKGKFRNEFMDKIIFGS
jgi:xylitol oxidase